MMVDAFREHGIKVDQLMEDWYWDGNLASVHVMNEFFPDARPHSCLQHAKVNTSRRFGDGCKKMTSMLQEFIAFLPPSAFHIRRGFARKRQGGRKASWLQLSCHCW